MRPAGGSEKFDERSQLCSGEVAKLLHAAIDDPFGHLLEEGVSLGGDRNPHDPPVVSEALAADEEPGFEPVDQARDVRGPRDEPGGKDERGKRFRGRIAEEAESVVLLGREVELANTPSSSALRRS